MFPPLSDVCLKDFQNNLGTATENDGLRDGLEKWRVYCIIKYIAASILIQPEQIFIWTSNFYSSTIVSTEMETNRKGNWVSKDSIWHLNGTTKAWGITPVSSNSLSIVKNAFHITPKYTLIEIGNSKILQNTPTLTIFCPNVPLKKNVAKSWTLIYWCDDSLGGWQYKGSFKILL